MQALQFHTGTILFAGLLVAGACGGGSSSGVDLAGSAEAGAGIDGGGVDATTIDAANAFTPSAIVSDGYVTTGPWAGHGFTATDPGAARIVPDCGDDTCNPPFVGKYFCMHGTVTGRMDWTGFAMLGWNVNQDTAGGAQLTWPVPETGGIIVTVDNPGQIPLRVQLQGTDPHSSADRWCAPLVSGQFIAWSSLVTNCWSGGKPQNPLAPGTPIQQAAIIVPGLQVDLPFDFCLVDVQVQGGPAIVDGGNDSGHDRGFDGGADGGSVDSDLYPG